MKRFLSLLHVAACSLLCVACQSAPKETLPPAALPVDADVQICITRGFVEEKESIPMELIPERKAEFITILNKLRAKEHEESENIQQFIASGGISTPLSKNERYWYPLDFCYAAGAEKGSFHILHKTYITTYYGTPQDVKAFFTPESWRKVAPWTVYKEQEGMPSRSKKVEEFIRSLGKESCR